MKHLLIISLISFLSLGSGLQTPDTARNIFGDQINLNNNQRNIIIVTQSPYCSVCIKLLSQYFTNTKKVDSVNYFTLNYWSDQVIARRNVSINTEVFFPNFTALFDNKEDGLLNYYDIKTYPAIILIDENNQTTVIKSEDIFDEIGNKLFIKEEIRSKMKNYINHQKY